MTAPRSPISKTSSSVPPSNVAVWGSGWSRRRLFAPFESVRQKVLLTDDEPGQRAFYESLGFAETRDFDDGSLRAFVKFG